MSLLREALELGLGALVLTKETAEEMLAGASEFTGDDTGDLRAKGRRLADELTALIRREVDATASRGGFVRRDEHEALAARVAALEAALAELTLARDGIEPAADL